MCCSGKRRREDEPVLPFLLNMSDAVQREQQQQSSLQQTFNESFSILVSDRSGLPRLFPIQGRRRRRREQSSLHNSGRFFPPNILLLTKKVTLEVAKVLFLLEITATAHCPSSTSWFDAVEQYNRTVHRGSRKKCRIEKHSSCKCRNVYFGSGKSGERGTDVGSHG